MLGLAAFFAVTLVFCAKAFEPARSRVRMVRRWIGAMGAAVLGPAVIVIASTAPEADLGMLGVLAAMFFVSLSAFIGSFRKPRPEKL